MHHQEFEEGVAMSKKVAGGDLSRVQAEIVATQMAVEEMRQAAAAHPKDALSLTKGYSARMSRARAQCLKVQGLYKQWAQQEELQEPLVALQRSTQELEKGISVVVVKINRLKGVERIDQLRQVGDAMRALREIEPPATAKIRSTYDRLKQEALQLLCSAPPSCDVPSPQGAEVDGLKGLITQSGYSKDEIGKLKKRIDRRDGSQQFRVFLLGLIQSSSLPQEKQEALRRWMDENLLTEEEQREVAEQRQDQQQVEAENYLKQQLAMTEGILLSDTQLELGLDCLQDSAPEHWRVLDGQLHYDPQGELGQPFQPIFQCSVGALRYYFQLKLNRAPQRLKHLQEELQRLQRQSLLSLEERVQLRAYMTEARQLSSLYPVALHFNRWVTDPAWQVQRDELQVSQSDQKSLSERQRQRDVRMETMECGFDAIVSESAQLLRSSEPSGE